MDRYKRNARNFSSNSTTTIFITTFTKRTISNIIPQCCSFIISFFSALLFSPPPVSQCISIKTSGSASFHFLHLQLQQTYLALVLQIALVSCNHYGNVISAPDAVDEFLVCNNFIEASSISDRVANDKSLSFAHVLLSHSCKLWLKRQKKTKNQEIMNWDFILCGSGRGCEDIIEVGNRANNNANKSKSQALPKNRTNKRKKEYHNNIWAGETVQVCTCSVSYLHLHACKCILLQMSKFIAG